MSVHLYELIMILIFMGEHLRIDIGAYPVASVFSCQLIFVSLKLSVELCLFVLIFAI